jgi:RNA polymerase sigma-70 factor (sigma-E family)
MVPMGPRANDEAFEAFVNERSRALLRYGFLLAGDPHTAADLVQEALLRLRDAWERGRGREFPEAYVRTTMSRLHISWWRRLRHEYVTEWVPEKAIVDPSLSRVEDDSGLWQALQTLGRRQRAVLVLRYYEGLDDDRIAELLGISRGTVRSQAMRALRNLRDHLTDPPDARTLPVGALRAPRRNRG